MTTRIIRTNTAHAAGSPQVGTFSRIAPTEPGSPLYRLVKQRLLGAIERGELPAGATIPGEAKLAAQFGVSIGTLRRAVDELVADNILVRRQGRGTFVAVHSDDRFLFQFFHVERCDGLRESPRVELIGFERDRADEDAAAALRLTAGAAVFQFENRLLLQGRAVVFDRLVVPAQLFRGLSERRLRERRSTIYHLYQMEFGVTVTHAHVRARAAAADRATARALGLAQGTPVIELRRTACTFGDRPVEYRRSILDTRQHEYVQHLKRPE